eukprot:1140791-Pelagomonas_calceolata.AAC.3
MHTESTLHLVLRLRGGIIEPSLLILARKYNQVSVPGRPIVGWGAYVFTCAWHSTLPTKGAWHSKGLTSSQKRCKQFS